MQQVVEALRNATLQDSTLKFPTEEYWRYLVGKTILLDESNFYRLVETCLERRTCNRVDQETGTVAQGALFSYEALPRASLLCSRIFMITAMRQNFLLCSRIFAEESFPETITIDGGHASPLAVCTLAREGFARMGIGGMQTRGLGSLLVDLSGREAGNG